MTNFTSEIKAAMAEAARFTNSSLTAKIRREAVAKGWPESVARTLVVDITKKERVQMSREAEDLEYGSESRVPIPVVRPFQETYLASAYTSNLRNALNKRGVAI